MPEVPRLIAAIIRHGEYHQLPDVPSAHQPFPLTALGEQQAEQAATSIRRQLRERDWQLHHTFDASNLLRAWQTATVIGRHLQTDRETTLQVEGFDALAERGVGSAANLTLSQIETIVDEDPRFGAMPSDWKSNSRFRLPLMGAESLLEAGERVAAHLRQRMHELAETVVSDTLKLFVGHGAAFRHAAYHLGVLDFPQIAQLSMYHAQPVFLEYRRDNTWHHLAGDWKDRRNSAPPLD